ncbi:MAG: ferrous iron transporter B [Actinobacteria bacterium]|nr:MAG: ferrous iron transporter B [Actinomycetota bacterium]
MRLWHGIRRRDRQDRRGGRAAADVPRVARHVSRHAGQGLRCGTVPGAAHGRGRRITVRPRSRHRRQDRRRRTVCRSRQEGSPQAVSRITIDRADDPVLAIAALRRGAPVIALLGNPNVGKSSLFNRVTGLGVATAHYPGTTVSMNLGETLADGRRAIILDLPGTYSLSDNAAESAITRRALVDIRPDAVVVVVDATNLARNLYLALQTVDLGLPVVIALNLMDEAERAGLDIDAVALGHRLGTAVVPVVASLGDGVDALIGEALSAADERRAPTNVRYETPFEELLLPVVAAAGAVPERPGGLGARALALLLFEGAPDLLGVSAGLAPVAGAAARARAASEAEFGEPPHVTLARERHGTAGSIAEAVTRPRDGGPRRGPRDLWAFTTSPLTGIPLVAVVMALVFGFLFVVGDALASGFAHLWSAFASPAIGSVIQAIAGTGTVAAILTWGFDAGVEASLSIGLPYILTFYVLLAVLEDSGYLNSLAFLTDRVMHRLGLHGRALLPLVAAAGCSVPAILSVRDLPSRRERLIASTLIALVPCSARTAVILGAVGHYIGWRPALGVFAVVFVIGIATGVGMNRLSPGHTGGLVMEMFGFRRPRLRGILKKAWVQFREFLFVATPIVIAGSLVVGTLYETGWLWRLAEPLSPIIVGWLGLPAIAGLTLVLGTLRKELALQLLIAMAVVALGSGAQDLTSFMTPTNLFVYALVNTLAVPCVSTITVLVRQHGWWRASAIVGFTVTVALLAGGLFARVLPLLGWA